MAPYTIPYNENSIYDAYDTSEFLSQAEKKMKLPGGRYDTFCQFFTLTTCSKQNSMHTKLLALHKPYTSIENSDLCDVFQSLSEAIPV